MDQNISEDFIRMWTGARPVVASFVASLVPDFHLAEDILQDVAVVLMNKFDAYDSSKPFTSWAIGIARYEVLRKKRDFARSRVVLSEGAMEMVANAYEEMVSDLEPRSQALRNCLKKVDGKSREILRMRYEQDIKPQEIARKMDKTAVAVRVALTRIRDSLRECMEKSGFSESLHRG